MNPSSYLAERIARHRKDLSRLLDDAKDAVRKAERYMTQDEIPVGFVNELAQVGRNAAEICTLLRELNDLAAIITATEGGK